MAAAITITEKTTVPIQLQLLQGGLALNLTGCVVSLLLTDTAGTVISTSTQVVTAATGIVQYNPTSTDLVAANSPYYARWKIIDGAGKVEYAPSTFRDIWDVTKE